MNLRVAKEFYKYAEIFFAPKNPYNLIFSPLLIVFQETTL